MADPRRELACPQPAEAPLPKRYYAHSLRLQNNEITTIAPLPAVLEQILAPFGTPPPPTPLVLVTWIDLSFNKIVTVDEQVGGRVQEEGGRCARGKESERPKEKGRKHESGGAAGEGEVKGKGREAG